MNDLALSLHVTLKEADQWDARLVHDLHLLHEIGISHVKQMLTCDKNMVLPVSSIAHLVSRRTVKDKHRRAWNQITHYLNRGTPTTNATPDLVNSQRTLHRTILNNLKSLWPKNQNAKTRTILHTLGNMSNVRHATAARDTMLEYYNRLHVSNPMPKATTIRTQQTTEVRFKTATSRTTGYKQYVATQQHRAQSRTKFVKAMHELYTMYSHRQNLPGTPVYHVVQPTGRLSEPLQQVVPAALTTQEATWHGCCVVDVSVALHPVAVQQRQQQQQQQHHGQPQQHGQQQQQPNQPPSSAMTFLGVVGSYDPSV
jgi:hypothetical protein